MVFIPWFLLVILANLACFHVNSVKLEVYMRNQKPRYSISLKTTYKHIKTGHKSVVLGNHILLNSQQNTIFSLHLLCHNNKKSYSSRFPSQS